MTAVRRLGPALVTLGGVLTTALLGDVYTRLTAASALVGFVALVPWVLTLDRARSWREAAGLGVAESVAFTAVVLSWLAGALAGYAQVPPPLGWLAVLALAPVIEPQFVAYAVTHEWAKRHGRVATLLVPALVYVGVEWLWPKLLGDTLGYGLYPLERLRQAADLGGVRGLTFVLLLCNAWAAASLRALGRAVPAGPKAALRAARSRAVLLPLAAVAALGAVLVGYGTLRRAQIAGASTRAGGLAVALVQASITDKRAAEAGTAAVVQSILKTHAALSDAALGSQPPDLVVWPETVYPTTFGTPKSDEGAAFDRDIAAYVASRRVPLLFGTYDREGGREYNAAVLLRPMGERRVEMSTYRKTMLFPLTEWVPPWLDGPWLRRLLPWAGHWDRGRGPETLSLEGTPSGTIVLAPMICYEAMFSGYVAEEARSADVIVALSNDSWFADGPAPELHLVAAAFRSIETRRPQVRATNSGVSAVVDAAGAVLARTEVGERTVLAARMPRLERTPTLVLAWGDWLGGAALPAAALVGLTAAREQRRAAGSRSRGRSKKTPDAAAVT
jgi:apolipoprotein N-acyltransferase